MISDQKIKQNLVNVFLKYCLTLQVVPVAAERLNGSTWLSPGITDLFRSQYATVCNNIHARPSDKCTDHMEFVVSCNASLKERSECWWMPIILSMIERFRWERRSVRVREETCWSPARNISLHVKGETASFAASWSYDCQRSSVPFNIDITLPPQQKVTLCIFNLNARMFHNVWGSELK